MPDTLHNKDSVDATWIFETDFNSKYVWRGIQFQDAVTWNPNITYSNKNFSINGWFNIPLYYYQHENKSMQHFNELDLNFNYKIEKKVSYTMITHSAQLFAPDENGNRYWGMINVFQGFYKGPIGVFINPEINYHPYKGGLYIEGGLNYNYDRINSSTLISLTYAIANRTFIRYNILNYGNNGNKNPYENVTLDASYQYNFSTFFIRLHSGYARILNYYKAIGYRNNYTFGVALGFMK